MFEPLFSRLDHFESPLCQRMSTWHQRPIVGGTFRVASWLGNGPAWGILIAATLVYSEPAVGVMLLATTAINLGLYKMLKSKTVRRRPFVFSAQVCRGGAVLDEFSFPSGHTLHAVSITTVLWSASPLLALWLVPVTLMIAASRVVLGLHYPSDVLAGAGLGVVVAQVILMI